MQRASGFGVMRVRHRMSDPDAIQPYNGSKNSNHSQVARTWYADTMRIRLQWRHNWINANSSEKQAEEEMKRIALEALFNATAILHRHLAVK